MIFLQVFTFHSANSESVAPRSTFNSRANLARLQRQVRQLPIQSQSKGCIDIFRIRHGQVSCSRESGCRMRCLSGYAFIGKESSTILTLPCDPATSQLMLDGHPWRPELTLCAPHCPDGCHNGGSCVSPGRCECPAGFGGSTCKTAQLQADEPAAIIRELAHNERRVECDEGQQMPDGNTTVILVYEKGHWRYQDGRILRSVDEVTCATIPPAPEVRQPATAPPKPAPSLRPVEPTTPSTAPFSPSGPRIGVVPLRTCTYPRFMSDLRATVAGNLSHLKFTCREGLATRDGRTWVTVTCRDGIWWRSEGQRLQESHVQCI